MYLALVRRTLVSGPDGDSYRPELPASLERPHGWGQASSKFEKDGKVLVWCRPVGAEADAIAAQPGAKLIGSICPEAESDRMVAALRAQPKTWPEYEAAREAARLMGPGAGRRSALEKESLRLRSFHRGALREFVTAYRGLAAKEERRAALAALPGTVAKILLAIAGGATMHWIAQRFGPGGVSIAMAVLATDAFTGAGSLDGATMSDGENTWALGLNGGWSQGAGAASPDAAEATEEADSLGYALTDIQVSLTTVGSSPQGVYAMARVATGAITAYGFGSNKETTTLTLKRWSVGSGTKLGADGSTVVGGDMLTVKSEADAITGIRNGGVDVGPVTDSNIASGGAGIYANGPLAGRQVDDFLVESLQEPSAPSSRSSSSSRLLLLGRRSRRRR